MTAMNDDGYTLELVEASDRRNLAFWTAKELAILGYRFLTRVHEEWLEEIQRTRERDGTVFLYAGLHKSLWETTGVLVPLYMRGMPLPYVGMGDNLVKGRLVEALSRRVGTFAIKRPTTRREMADSARGLRRDILGLLARGHDVLIFPEGTRKSVPSRDTYGDFFPAAFDPLLDYERNKERFCAANPGTRPLEVFVVPFNVDYSRLREAGDLVRSGSDKPQTLNVLDALSLLRHVGDTHVSFGQPVSVTALAHLDRKGLAQECRRLCMDLVKILPVNVASLGMLELDSQAPFSAALLEEAVGRVVERLRPHARRFRGFGPDDPPAEIVRRARHRALRLDGRQPDELARCRLYAGYVRHLL